MNIIDELRSIAKFIDKGLGVELNAITDRLAASGALVPVPDGEACLLDELQQHHFVFQNGDVWVYGKLACDMFRITDNYRVSVRKEFCEDVRFQPVALVPIAEAEV